MGRDSFQPLSTQDQSFLLFEGPTTTMNVGGVSLFEAGPLRTEDGGVDVARIRRYVESRLHLAPRYRQRLAYIPIEDRPVWVDDDRFDLDYHVRHIAVPRPGTLQQLKEVAAPILERHLDRSRPLWELWIAEGIQGNLFATINKAHHCMIDGVSGVELSAALMQTEPDSSVPRPKAWRPRPAPSGIQLLRDDVLQRVQLPFKQGLLPRVAMRNPLRSDFADRLGALWSTLGSGLRGASDTPLNRPIGPHRRFDWLDVDLAALKQIKNTLGGTVNDVVLTIVAGAVQRFFKRRRFALKPGSAFRVAVPVNVRTEADRGLLGNRVSVWLSDLPINERDPRRRLGRIGKTTSRLKQTKQAAGTEILMQVAEWTGSALIRVGAQLAARVNPYNLIVTNVPGPQFPLYMLGARMIGAYPMVPLWEHQGLGIALFSYDGRVCWGFNGDWDAMRDIDTFAADVRAAFDELARAAAPAKSRRRAVS